MNPTRLARRLGLLGAFLGAVAGVVQASVGSRIPEWSGAKESPGELGVLTVLLSVLAGVCVLAPPRDGRLNPGPRLAWATGLVVVGGLCFTTVGRLWFVPGPLLLLSCAVALSGASRREYRYVVRTHWWQILLSVLGVEELLMAVSASTPTAVVGVLGGLAVVVAPWLLSRSRRRTAGLLVVGVLPFVTLTYWAVVPVLVGVLAAALGALVIDGRRRRARREGLRPATRNAIAQ